MNEESLQFLIKQFKQRWNGMNRAWLWSAQQLAIQTGQVQAKNRAAGDGGIFDFDEGLKAEIKGDVEDLEIRQFILYVAQCITKRPLTGPDGRRYILGKGQAADDIFVEVFVGVDQEIASGRHEEWEKQRREGSLGVRFVDQRILNKKPSDRTPEEWKSFL